MTRPAVMAKVAMRIASVRVNILVPLKEAKALLRVFHRSSTE
jgi:hypothetical protein